MKGRADPDAAEWRRRIANSQLADCRLLAKRLEQEHRLASGWTVKTAADMLWALTSTELLERLLIDRRWSTLAYAERLTRLLHSTFVAPLPDSDGSRAGAAVPATADMRARS